jgi:hypothetical protein
LRVHNWRWVLSWACIAVQMQFCFVLLPTRIRCFRARSMSCQVWKLAEFGHSYPSCW